METASIITILGFGFMLGLKHAIEADHLAAVSTIVTQRKNAFTASLVGGLWGIGHTISLFAVGLIIILFHLEISEKLEKSLEFCVALMLIVLGVDALRKIVSGGQIHSHEHKHGQHSHSHPHSHEAEDAHSPDEIEQHSHEPKAVGIRPVIVGMIHGLAGSGALMLLVLATISSPGVGLVYILIFGLGSVGGMMLMSLLLGLPLQFAADRFRWIEIGMRGIAGLFSLGLGIFMVYEIGFVEGLFGI